MSSILCVIPNSVAPRPPPMKRWRRLRQHSICGLIQKICSEFEINDNGEKDTMPRNVSARTEQLCFNCMPACSPLSPFPSNF